MLSMTVFDCQTVFAQNCAPILKTKLQNIVFFIKNFKMASRFSFAIATYFRSV